MEGTFGTTLIVDAAQVGRASGVMAFGGVHGVDRSVVVGACMVLAECFATAVLHVLFVVALPRVGIAGRGVAIGADD